MGQHGNAHKLVLFMGCSMDLGKFVAKVIEVLSIVMPVWKSVDELHMELNTEGNLENPGHVRKLAGKLFRFMPAVTQLYVNSEQDEDEGGLVGALIDLYAGQLVKCESYVVVEPKSAVFENLTRAVIRLGFDSNEQMCYQVPLQKLTHMYIAGDLQQTMHQLQKAHSTGSVEFAQLEQLCILSPVGDRLEEPYDFANISFPRLSVLRVNPSRKISQLLLQARMPCRLDKLEILTLYMGTIVLYNVSLDEPGKGKLAELLGNESNFWAMTDFLFGTAQLSSHAVLTLGTLPQNSSLAETKWQHLTKLEVIPTIKLQALLQLIPQLSQMTELVVHDLEFDEEWEVVENGYERLEILRLNYDVTETNQRMVMKLLARLLPKLLHIEELFLPMVPHDFYTFVQEYGAKYPHIAGFAPDF
ncbi:hypothetical protein IWW36_004515 [Coemansia brasiliensis]|uniref:Uncharacterized protein n=1 Tax=Coemansia brasiliensis TaxID=2650707 RepID=A0A9W8IC07_9FUNG|nr:hypothetical protein IWW36_004515 [Coemansia brasiliensis]